MEMEFINWVKHKCHQSDIDEPYFRSRGVSPHGWVLEATVKGEVDPPREFTFHEITWRVHHHKVLPDGNTFIEATSREDIQ